jgi:hypothetical protein
VGTYPDDGYGGALIFQDQSNAGTAVITNQATADAYYGGVNFYNSSSAQGASITNEAATDNDHGGAETWFFDDSTASSAYIVNQGGLTEGGSGEVIFEDSPPLAIAPLLAKHRRRRFRLGFYFGSKTTRMVAVRVLSCMEMENALARTIALSTPILV